MNKSEYPKVIADMLGIPPIFGTGGPWMSTRGTVMSEWVKAVSEALDVPYENKVATMRAMIESVGVRWNATTMASENTPSAGAGNISTPAFVALLEGLSSQPAARRRRQLRPGGRATKLVPDASDDLRTLRAVQERRGQPTFRANLLSAYGNRCALTGCDAIAALEAAHIKPYANDGTYSTSNGLLLRSDVHTLFDLLLVTFDLTSKAVVLHPQLHGTTYEAELAELSLRMPDVKTHEPSRDALLDHRLRSGL